jgi:oligopeptide transport system permease protein
MPFLWKKAAIFFGSLFCGILLTFLFMHAIPGDPFAQENAIPAEVLQALHHHYGLDRTLPEQFIQFLKQLLQFDLGPSLHFPGRSVNEIILESFPISLCLGLEAIAFALPTGIFLGIAAGLARRKWQDRFFASLTVLGISVPSFVLATVLQYVLAFRWELLPIARWGTFAHSIIPALSLAAMPTAFIARLTRSGVMEMWEQDFILTARAKGLPLFRILTHHVLPNVCLPVIAYLGPLSASILTGSFAIEKIFGIPGLGQWFVMSVIQRDYTLIMGLALFYSTLLLCVNFIVDLLYAWVNPRVRVGIRHA